MRLGITDHVDCAHMLPGHTKCGRLHGHTYRVDLIIEGDKQGGMVADFAELKAQLHEVLETYDHRHWNDFLDYPSVENICERLADELEQRLSFTFVLRVWEGHGKWAEIQRDRARAG
jgi:6-pyruvoyltetrahydropterin/6-carboxytetrahydropterin synthase